jgi:hypothetical protein
LGQSRAGVGKHLLGSQFCKRRARIDKPADRLRRAVCSVCGATAAKFGSKVTRDLDSFRQCEVARNGGVIDVVAFECPNMTKAIAEAED